MNINGYSSDKCCSCGVCSIVCPSNAVTMQLDKLGFYKPLIQNELCTNCGLCTKVCYKYLTIKKKNSQLFINNTIFAAWSRNSEVVKTTSSGGIGYELLRNAIKLGYSSCGVIYDYEKDLCKHTIIEHLDHLRPLKGSKYIQSFTQTAFTELKKTLRCAIIGTPCQIYAIRKAAEIWGKEQDFIFIDFFCHGTPSINLWKKYLEYIKMTFGLNELRSIDFRCKKETTWHKFSMRITDRQEKTYKQVFNNDLFFKFFLTNSCLNEPCYECKLRLDHTASDFRIGDFWGDKFRENDEGVSLVVINSKLGENIWSTFSQDLHYMPCNLDDLLKSQPHKMLIKHKAANKVLQLLASDMPIMTIYKKTIQQSFLKKIKNKITKKIFRIK